jgi:hypothetical protein
MNTHHKNALLIMNRITGLMWEIKHHILTDSASGTTALLALEIGEAVKELHSTIAPRRGK